MIKNLLNQNLNKYTKIVNEINLLEENLNLLSDIQLKEQTFKLRKQYQKQKSLSNIIAPAFALTRESAQRNIGLRHYDVQLLGGLALNDGKIAEMQTGEGKTLVSTLPAYLNALTGKGVHIVTVNDYLANRDQNWVGQVHRRLGLKVGLIQENMNFESRKLNYNADITYVTNSELGFDYLRDNTATTVNDIVQRNLNYCIVDEVDSILIDEAKTPLVLSGYEDANINKYIIAAEVVKYLTVQSDFEIDEKNKNIIITEKGILQAQQLLKIDNLFNPKNPWISFVINALKANFLFFKNIGYIVKDERVMIVDESPGEQCLIDVGVTVYINQLKQKKVFRLWEVVKH
jgi:preprotein translocase subunit SecA